MRALPLLLVAALAAAGSGACTPREPSPSTQNTTSPVTPTDGPPPADGMFQSRGAVVVDTPAGPLRFGVELALTNAERQRGLMNREKLDDDAGMLFIFETNRIQSFWMKNTLIPLDMIFIDEGGTVAGIVESAEPLTLSSRKVDKPSRYVLELAGGATRRFGIAAGQRVRFEGVPAELVDARVLSSAPSAPAPTTP